MNWMKTIISGLRRRHRDRKAPPAYRVMTPWEARQMYASSRYNWRYRLTGGHR